jgi:glycosyltransferase involved in cell wall biosynthesis
MTKISLCITTKNRFDKFLSKSLDSYIELVKSGVIDEIVVCDENGNDFQKINEKYSALIDGGFKLRVFKNNQQLGVFLNKLKVCKMANNDCIALIDSDNVVDETYFRTVKEYMDKTTLPEYYILSPCFGRPHDGMDYRKYKGEVIRKYTVREYVVLPKDDSAVWDIPLMWNICFISLLNMGNYVLSKNIVHKVTHDPNLLKRISGCDVMYFNYLVFRQIPDNEFQFHVVDGLEYDHSVHDGSLQRQEGETANEMLWEHLIQWYRHEVYK